MTSNAPDTRGDAHPHRKSQASVHNLEQYRSLSRNLADVYSTRRLALTQMLREISSLAHNVTPTAEVQGRLKSLHSTWSKMRANCSEVHQVMDGLGIRVIVSRNRDCYRLVEQIHRIFEVINGEFDDYIKNPKPNGYQSLHTTVVGPHGHTVEVQVRTRWMHTLAESGSAAHDHYKHERTTLS